MDSRTKVRNMNLDIKRSLVYAPKFTYCFCLNTGAVVVKRSCITFGQLLKTRSSLDYASLSESDFLLSSQILWRHHPGSLWVCTVNSETSQGQVRKCIGFVQRWIFFLLWRHTWCACLSRSKYQCHIVNCGGKKSNKHFSFSFYCTFRSQLGEEEYGRC